jgi:hypothetical protein
MSARDDPARQAAVRGMWWARIRALSETEAKAALLQVLADIDEHWAKEHPEDGSPEDLGIPPDEYLRQVITRTRAKPPTEVATDGLNS